MKEVICVDLRLVEVMVVNVSWFLKVILNCSVRVSVTTVFLVTRVNILQNRKIGGCALSFLGGFPTTCHLLIIIKSNPRTT